MGGVHESEAEDRTLELPVTRRHLLDPVASDSEIRVLVIGLPSVTGKADLPLDGVTLGQ